MRPRFLYPAIPAAGLVMMPFIPFVNTAQLWFGLPRMLVWGVVCCLLLSVALGLCEKSMPEEGDE